MAAYTYPTTPLYNVLAGIQGRGVLNQAGANAIQLQALIGLVNNRLRRAWNFYRWPYTTVTEGRFFYPAWASGSAYTAVAGVGPIVYYAGTLVGYFECIATTTAGQSPDTTPASWRQVCHGEHWSVGQAQAGQTVFDTVLDAYDRDPLAYDDARPVSFSITNEGVSFRQSLLRCTNQVWITLRLPPPNYAGAVLYSAAVAYAAGVNVYYSGTGFGDVYQVLLTTTAGDTPVSAPTKFGLVPFPSWLEDAVEVGCLVDWLRGDGQGDKAAQIEGTEGGNEVGTFYGVLEEAVYQLVTLQGQQGRFQTQGRAGRRHC